MRFLRDLSLADRRVLVRADFNVPLDENLKITDENRITQFLPTLRYILEQKGKAILMSHLGDGSGKVDPKTSLLPVAKRLTELMGMEIQLAPDCVGQDVETLVNKLQPGQAILLQNLRYHAGEKNNDAEFASLLARLGDVYVNDAFATAHRAHASIVGVAKLFKERAAGLLMQKEVEYYERALLKPKSPLCVVLGGAKVSTKLNCLLHLADKADKLIIGGAMANTFLAAQGLQMGRSLYEPELIGKAVEILGMLARRDKKVYLPVDFMAAPSLSSRGLARAVTALEMPAELQALDIGPASSLLFREAIQSSETIIWNGPMGAFENEDFSKGTTDLIESIAGAHGLKVAGGGDTDAAIHQMELAHKFDFISTGGGAFLALLEGQGLPAFTALEG
jgi:phosphoglycerate kinase